MDKEAIVNLIEEKNSALIAWLERHDNEKWLEGPNNKWTTGQHALHLLQSIKPLNNALSLPKVLLRYKYGTNNREVRDYDTVVKRYKERLSNVKEGATFKASRNMKVPSIKEKAYLLNRLQVESKKLQYKTRKISDEQLDHLILPHPLMGKMPVREIIMWTAHHIEHHTNTLKEKYK
ncbi:DinB family protein [uncultured Psychroserpens sp.]|uniref:DinB family protein n=1 Tax=uncultured Psychroserpens sp. TaxID=255436 RepID=UPI00260D416A|nr:DinB family protein [uncultured Psychroserpens sp.]